MSLKVTIKIDGQSEQQLAPVISQVLGRYSRGLDAQGNGAKPTQSVYSEQLEPLQQQIQRLAAQNQMLQNQLSQSQPLLAGTPPAKAFPPPPDRPIEEPLATSKATVCHSADAHQPSASVPALPAQYQGRRSAFIFGRIGRSLSNLLAQLCHRMVWLLLKQERLLLFLLLCGGLYGTWAIADKLTSHLLRDGPEFVESAGDGPGETDSPKNGSDKAEENLAEAEPAPSAPASPTSKAGSNPPPPPAFAKP